MGVYLQIILKLLSLWPWLSIEKQQGQDRGFPHDEDFCEVVPNAWGFTIINIHKLASKN